MLQHLLNPPVAVGDAVPQPERRTEKDHDTCTAVHQRVRCSAATPLESFRVNSALFKGTSGPSRVRFGPAVTTRCTHAQAVGRGGGGRGWGPGGGHPDEAGGCSRSRVAESGSLCGPEQLCFSQGARVSIGPLSCALSNDWNDRFYPVYFVTVLPQANAGDVGLFPG